MRYFFWIFWLSLSVFALLVGVNHHFPFIQQGYFSFILEDTFGNQYIQNHIPFLYSSFPILIQSHALSGTTMIFIWPLQFSKKVRVSSPKIHRALGVVFYLCALYTGSSAVVIGFIAPFAGTLESISTSLVSLVYLFCIFKSLNSLRRRKYKKHGQWNLRIVALSLGIISQRTLFAFESLIPHGLNINNIFVLTAILGFFGNLLIAEIGIRRLKL